MFSNVVLVTIYESRKNNLIEIGRYMDSKEAELNADSKYQLIFVKSYWQKTWKNGTFSHSKIVLPIIIFTNSIWTKINLYLESAFNFTSFEPHID